MEGNYSYDSSSRQVSNKRRLAALLLQQSQEGINPMRGSENGGYVVPFQPLEGVAKVAQALAGSYISGKADDEERQAAADRKRELVDALNSGDRNQMLAASGEEGLMEALKQNLKPKDAAHMNQVIYGKDKLGNVVAYGAGSDFSTHPLMDAEGNPIMVDRYKTDPNMMVTPGASGPQLSNIPGATTALTRQAQAREYGKQSQMVREIPMGDGSTQLGTWDSGGLADDSMVKSVIQVESGGNPNAVSPKGAGGLMQLMPGTAARYGLQGNDVFNPQKNTQAGTAYLNEQLKDFGNEDMAYAAFNAGPQRVRDAVDRYGNDWLSHMPQETQAYVPKVKAVRAQYIQQAQQQINQRPVPQNIGQLATPQEQGIAPQQAQQPQGNYPIPGRTQTLAEQEAIKKQAEIEAARAKQQIDIEAVAPKIKAKAEAEAAAGLPDAVANGNYMVDVIDKALKHPGLANSVGGWSLSGLSHIPGTKEHDFAVVMDQLKGKAFMDAYQSLKGGGQITEIEGQKATEAIGRMNVSQSEKEFKAGLEELKGIIQQGVSRAQKKAGVQPEATKAESPRIIRFDANGDRI